MLAWHTDRLHRSPVELETYIAASEVADAPTHTVKAGPVDLSTPSGRLVARQLGAVARYEVEHAVERGRRKREQMAAAGEYRGGGRPFGYEADGRIVRAVEAGELVGAARLVLAGQSTAQVAAEWNRRGVGTSRGGRWSGLAVRRVLIRPRNAALIDHDGAIVGPAGWAPLLDEATWAGLRAVLGDGHPTRAYAPRAERLLTGIAGCGVAGCGAHLVGAGRSAAGTARYRCSASDHLKRQADPLDGYVAAIVVARLSRADAADLLPASGSEQAAELHTRSSAARARLDELGECFAAGEIDRRQLAAGTQRIRTELAALTDALARLSTGHALDGLAGRADAADVWAELPLERRRAVVAELLDVTVLPARRGGTGAFDPAYVQVTPNTAP